MVADAVRVYLEKQSWVQFVERNERRAKEMSISESDVDRLIAEYRAETGAAATAKADVLTRARGEEQKACRRKADGSQCGGPQKRARRIRAAATGFGKPLKKSGS